MINRKVRIKPKNTETGGSISVSNETTANFDLEQVLQDIDAKIKSTAEQTIVKSEDKFMTKEDFIKMLKENVDKASSFYYNKLLDQIKSLPTFCTTLDELQTKVKEKVDKNDFNISFNQLKNYLNNEIRMSMQNELKQFETREDFPHKISGGSSNAMYEIENPTELTEFIKSNFKLKYLGIGVYKLYGRIGITVNSETNDKIMGFKFPNDLCTEYKSMTFGRLYDSKQYQPITIDLKRDSFSFKFIKISTDKEHFVSFEHILHLSQVDKNSLANKHYSVFS